MKQLKSRLFSLFMVMLFAMIGLPAMAASTTYYSKATVKSTGNGTVYVATSDKDDASKYDTEVSATNSSTTQDDEQTYYLFATPADGYKLEGWYTNEECTEGKVNGNTVSVKASSKEQGSPTVGTWYAKFVEASAATLGYTETKVYVNIDNVTYKNESLVAENLTSAIAYASANENVVTVADDGTLVPVANGTTTITASADGTEASYEVTVIDNVAAGKTQIGNGDFEDWRNSTSSNNAPDNWNSFQTAEGGYASFVTAQQVAMKEGGRPGSNGKYYVDIYSRSVIGVPAQGNLTLGCINAGATSAANKNNYNFSKVTDAKKSETIDAIPTAIKAWVKFVPGKANADYPYARIAATIHDEYNYITYGQASDDTEANKSHALAQAALNFPACEWTEVIVPFLHTGNTTDGQKYIIVNFSTNATPGQGQAGDHLYIDDVELIYGDVTMPHDKYIAVAVNGVHNAPAESHIDVTYNNNGTIDFNLNNFALNDNGTDMNVGNISLKNLAIDLDGNFAFDGNIQIEAGDKEGVDVWMGPLLGDIPAKLNGTITNDYFFVNIDINVGYPVEVEVGDLAQATVKITDAGVSTFCAPFTLAIPEAYQDVVVASTVTGVDANGCTLLTEEVEDYLIPANTPVLVEAPMAAELPVAGIYQKGTPKAGLLTGVYADTKAPKGVYVLQSHEGIVGFYQVESIQPTVKANRAYLTAPAGSEVKGFFLNAEDATVIDKVAAENGNENVYDLNGRRVLNAQKGVFIVNGKKVIK